MNLRSLGYDSLYWEDPDVFHPERHLNNEGKYTKPSHLTTFGLGNVIHFNILNNLLLLVFFYLLYFMYLYLAGQHTP